MTLSWKILIEQNLTRGLQNPSHPTKLVNYIFLPWTSTALKKLSSPGSHNTRPVLGNSWAKPQLFCENVDCKQSAQARTKNNLTSPDYSMFNEAIPFISRCQRLRIPRFVSRINVVVNFSSLLCRKVSPPHALSRPSKTCRKLERIYVSNAVRTSIPTRKGP